MSDANRSADGWAEAQASSGMLSPADAAPTTETGTALVPLTGHERVQMPTEAPPPGSPEAQRPGRTVVIPGEVMLGFMETALAAMEQRLIEMKVPPAKLAEFHINRAALILAGYDEPNLRGQLVGAILAGFAAAVEGFYTATHSRNGIIIPNGAMRAGLRL